MSWVAPPLVSLVSGPFNNNYSNSNSNNNNSSHYGSRSVSASFRDKGNNPLGNTASLRERVSQLREMALFPDSTAQRMNIDASSLLLSSSSSAQNSSPFPGYHNRSASPSSYSATAAAVNATFTNTILNSTRNSSSSSLASSVVNQHRMIFRKGNPASKSVAEDAAAAMGVPVLWIDRPTPPVFISPTTTATRDRNNKNISRDSLSNKASPSPSPSQRRSFYPYSGETGDNSADNTSPIRSVFEDPGITGAALRLHSFVHAEEEPAVKSSRLYQAYVAMERSAPRSERALSPFPVSKNNNSNNSNTTNNSVQQQQQKPGAEISISPVRESSAATSASGGGFPSDDASSIYTSPEHHRLIRKLSHEAQAPPGVEVTRMLRFLSATEAMNRGALEQEAESVLRSSVANHRYGILHSRGISADRGPHEHQAKVFLNN